MKAPKWTIQYYTQKHVPTTLGETIFSSWNGNGSGNLIPFEPYIKRQIEACQRSDSKLLLFAH